MSFRVLANAATRGERGYEGRRGRLGCASAFWRTRLRGGERGYEGANAATRGRTRLRGGERGYQRGMLSEESSMCCWGSAEFHENGSAVGALEKYPDVSTTLIHTGQHYDSQLSDVFFHDLEMKKPDIHLEVGSGKHGQQTARVLEKMEEVLEKGAADGAPTIG